VYALFSLVLIVAYPFLPDTGRLVAFRVVALAAIPAVLFGAQVARRCGQQQRLWWIPLLVLGLVIVNVANTVRLFPGPSAESSSGLIDALGNVVVLAAALALVLRCGRGDFGGVIDTALVALALGGFIWDFLLLPNEDFEREPLAARVDAAIVVFALAGILGALIRVAHSATRGRSALRLLVAALLLALAGNVVQALAGNTWLLSVSTMMFMGAYTGVGLFGLDPPAYELGAGPDMRDDLSGGRLLFLGLALAIIPIAFGADDLADGRLDGALLVVGGGVVTALVMVRIRRLSAERDRAEEALKQLAMRDPLTSLLNRREFVTRLDGELSSATPNLVLFCDLDGFKEVNDRLGHSEGDRLLIVIAERLVESVRDTDVVARLGGDEFLILLNAAGPGHVDGILDRIAATLSRPIELRGESVRIGASIGLASSTDESDPEELIRRADVAMYRAKRSQPDVPTVRMVTAGPRF
jgi:diguanylate cyclase (GGDEF)-like protein